MSGNELFYRDAIATEVPRRACKPRYRWDGQQWCATFLTGSHPRFLLPGLQERLRKGRIDAPIDTSAIDVTSRRIEGQP